MAKAKQPKKTYTETFETRGQRVINGGTEIAMLNGRRFKRTVLPSVAERKKHAIDELIDETLSED